MPDKKIKNIKLSLTMKKTHKNWKERDPEGYKRHQQKAGKAGAKKLLQWQKTSKGKEFYSKNSKKNHKNWKKNNPEWYSKEQSRKGKLGGKIGGKVTQQKHPELRKKFGQWVKDNPERLYESRKKGGKVNYQKNGRKNINKAIKWCREHPEFMSKHALKIHKKYPNLGKKACQGLLKWKKENPDLVKKIGQKAGQKAGIIMHKNWKKRDPKGYRQHQIKACIKGLESQTKKGFVSKPELLMKQMLPTDFLHGVELGGFIPDFHSPERKIVIEVDGVYWHSKPEAKEKDEIKNKRYQNMGYQVFRFTDLDVHWLKEVLV